MDSSCHIEDISAYEISSVGTHEHPQTSRPSTEGRRSAPARPRGANGVSPSHRLHHIEVKGRSRLCAVILRGFFPRRFSVRRTFEDISNAQRNIPISRFIFQIVYTATGSPTKRPAPVEDDDPKGERRRFVLFSTLQTMYQLGGDHRLVDQIRRSILSCLAVDDNHDNVMDVFYSSQSSFLNLIVDSMLEAYWRAFTATPKHSGARRT
jgi:hypothetical protein